MDDVSQETVFYLRTPVQKPSCLIIIILHDDQSRTSLLNVFTVYDTHSTINSSSDQSIIDVVLEMIMSQQNQRQWIDF